VLEHPSNVRVVTLLPKLLLLLLRVQLLVHMLPWRLLVLT
jgi:hypothetical protein